MKTGKWLSANGANGREWGGKTEGQQLAVVLFVS